jgi:hypothetical protein
MNNVASIETIHRLNDAKEAARKDILFRSLIRLNHSEQLRVFYCGPDTYLFFLYPQQRYVSEEHALVLVEAAQLVGAR